MTPTDRSALILPASIVIAGLLIGGGLYFGLANSSSSGQGGTQPSVSVNIKDVKTDGDPYIGDKDAKVVLAYWFDYQCPFCKAFDIGHPQISTQPALPQIIKDYVETGKVKVVFKDFAFLGPDSQAAAGYGHAIWKLYPTQYFAWHEAMMKAQDDENAGFGDAESINALIKKDFPQMDVAAITADIAANKAAYDAAIEADQQEGQRFGINGTPGFITGKTTISGAQPFSEFKAAFDPQL